MATNIEQFERRSPERELWTRAGPVRSHFDNERVEQLEETSVATVADPTTLGLWGFATGTWIAGTVVAGWFPQAAFTATVPVLLLFAGIVQFIAGLYAFRRANMLAATAFCCFGAFNATAAFYFFLQATGYLPAAGYSAILLGFLLESFGFIAFALTLGAVKTNMGMVATLATLTLGYVLSGVPNCADAVGPTGWHVISEIGGSFLIVSAICAYYTGMAMVVNSSWGRVVLPIGGRS